MDVKSAQETQAKATRDPANQKAAPPMPALTGGIDRWSAAQWQFLDAWQAVADDWFERRRHGIAEARRTCEALSGCRDAGEFMTLQQKWLAGAIGRLSADVRALAEGMMSASQQNADAARESIAGLTQFAAPIWRTVREAPEARSNTNHEGPAR